MELLEGDMGVQYFTITEGDHLGTEGVEVLFFPLFILLR